MSSSRDSNRMRFIRENKKAYQLNEMQREEIKDAFDLFDFTQTKGLDQHELKEAMRALNVHPTDELL